MHNCFLPCWTCGGGIPLSVCFRISKTYFLVGKNTVWDDGGVFCIFWPCFVTVTVVVVDRSKTVFGVVYCCWLFLFKMCLFVYALNFNLKYFCWIFGFCLKIFLVLILLLLLLFFIVILKRKQFSLVVSCHHLLVVHRHHLGCPMSRG